MLQVCGLSVRFEAMKALDNLNLEVRNGEILALVGPSGCGKSTLLRAIAGLQPVDTGTITLDGRELGSLRPHQRGIGLMFQSDALLAHRTVGENIEFGLRMKNIGEPARVTRTGELLELVGLGGYGQRRIATLSGGESQRVALARSLAPEPKLLLLDEPFGSLDRALRDRLIDDVPAILQEANMTTVHVTHDHGEAFAVGHRVAVMDSGNVVHIGTPEEVWAHPNSTTTARFLGHANIIALDSAAHLIRADAADVDSCDVDRSTLLAGNALAATVVSRRYLGGRYLVRFETDTFGELRFELDHAPAVGARVRLRIDPTRVVRLRG